MKRESIIVIMAIVTGLIGIRLATLVDEPEHIINPDPDCSICQAYQSQVLLVPDIDIISPSRILLYLNEPRPTDLYTEFHNPLFSIRAPPQF